MPASRSRDGGKTWDILSGGLPDHIRANIEGMAMDVWNGGYAIFAGTTDGDVFTARMKARTGRRLLKELDRSRSRTITSICRWTNRLRIISQYLTIRLIHLGARCTVPLILFLTLAHFAPFREATYPVPLFCFP